MRAASADFFRLFDAFQVDFQSPFLPRRAAGNFSSRFIFRRFQGVFTNRPNPLESPARQGIERRPGRLAGRQICTIVRHRAIMCLVPTAIHPH
jgi:hypothetical protein